MWRFGYVNPVNYNDNELFCGGVAKQFQTNGGNCGICGDSYEEPSPQTHETGGKFGNRIISKTYVMGSIIDIEIEITANHKGSFQLKLCPVAGREREASQECLDRNVLTQLDGEEERFPIYESPHSIRLTRRAELPAGLTCSRCVLQWTWTSANSWGNCGNGTGALGCGPQETFRNCADIRIVRSASQLPATDNPRAIMVADSNSKTGQSALVVRSQVCVATAAYNAFHGMSSWCQQNCLRYPPHCPTNICTCLTSCRALPGQTKHSDFSCSRSCLRFPHTEECPAECQCTSNPGTDFSQLEAVIVDARATGGSEQERPLLYNLNYFVPQTPSSLLYLPRLPVFRYF